MDTLYTRFILRWWWLITIAVGVAIAATHLAVGQQVPLYRAQSTLQVGRTIQDKNPEQNEFAIMDRLVPAYAELAKRDPILIATAETLNLPLNPDQLRLRLLVTRVPSAPLIDIAVVDSDPQRAMAIANEVARQVILQSPTAAQDDQSQAFIKQQLADLQKKISDGQTEITAQQEHIGTLTSASDVEEAQRKLSALQGQVESWQASYARLVGQVEPSRTNLVSIMSQATLSTEPLPTRNMLYYLLALVIGAGLSIVLALVLDLFDRSISGANELGVIAEELPVLTVPRYKMPIEGGPVIQSAPTSEAAAAYRLLRNTLSASSVASGGSTIAVTSSRVAEGKTTTVSNLAVALSNAGRAVILVDANLHNPDLDRHFALEGRQGFGDLLLGECTLSEAIQVTANTNLSIITAGSIPANYVDLLSRDKVRDVLELLAKSAEIILFDTPAVAEEQDTLLLTKYVDGVVLVAEAGRINREELTETLALLKRNDAPVVALALNKVRLPRLNLRRAPWSREMRNRAHAQQRREAHSSASIVLKPEEL